MKTASARCSNKTKLFARVLFFASIASLFLLNSAAAFQQDFELVNDGAVIARNGNNTAFPSVIRVPSWVTVRPDPSANYYMYYGNHSGSHIRLKWAASIDGPWTQYDLNAGSENGVFDVGSTNDPSRDDYDHISAPDVIIDTANQRFVMYFHGQRAASSPAGRVHERFVATSGTGLNFNDPVSGNGEPGHGPIEVDVLTNSGLSRDVWIGDEYGKVFEKDGRFYSVGKRGAIHAAPEFGNIWAQPANAPFGEAWEREDSPEPNWASLTTGPDDAQDQYYSPAATFLASQEFADHPNNPENRRIYSNGNDERLNHVDVNVLPNEMLEVFFYVREASSNRPDDYNSIYRIVYDISEDDFQDWSVSRDGTGLVIFEVALSPHDVSNAVEEAVGVNYDASIYADPISLGDTEIFLDDDGSKYLFFSFVSDEFGGAQGEGSISAVRLFLLGDVNRDGVIDFLDVSPFIAILVGGTYQAEADINRDGIVDFLDIAPFIAILSAQ